MDFTCQELEAIERNAKFIPRLALCYFSNFVMLLSMRVISTEEMKTILSEMLKVISIIRSHWPVESPVPKHTEHIANQAKKAYFKFLTLLENRSDYGEIEEESVRIGHIITALNYQDYCVSLFQQRVEDNTLDFLIEISEQRGYPLIFMQTSRLEVKAAGERELEKLIPFKQSECPLCLKDYGEENITDYAVMDACGHSMCAGCAEELFMGFHHAHQRKRCPVCRTKVVHWTTTRRLELYWKNCGIEDV